MDTRSPAVSVTELQSILFLKTFNKKWCRMAMMMFTFTPLHSLLIMKNLATMFHGYKIRSETLMPLKGKVCSVEGIMAAVNVWVLDWIHNQITPRGASHTLHNFSEWNCVWIQPITEYYVCNYRQTWSDVSRDDAIGWLAEGYYCSVETEVTSWRTLKKLKKKKIVFAARLVPGSA